MDDRCRSRPRLAPPIGYAGGIVCGTGGSTAGVVVHSVVALPTVSAR
jgi:hypothetical protein